VGCREEVGGSRPPPHGKNEASLESRAECKNERKKEGREKEQKRKSLHKTLERAEDYSEITHMRASREVRGLEWGFGRGIVPE